MVSTGRAVALVLLVGCAAAFGQGPEPKRSLVGHERPVLGLDFAPDGKTLASCGYDGTIRLWDVETGRCLATLEPHAGAVNQVVFSPDGTWLASSGSKPSVILWDVATRREVARLEGQGRVVPLAFSPDGRLLATGGYDDRTIRLWDVGAWDQGGRLLGKQPSDVFSLTFSPDGKSLASGGRDGTVRFWDVDRRRESAVLTGHRMGVLRVAFSPDGRTLVTASPDRTVRTWDVAARKELDSKEADSGLACLALSPDGMVLASCGEDAGRSVKLWDFPALRGATALSDAPANAFIAAFSPDGRTFAAAGADGRIRVWEVPPAGGR
jgi:WD40 repeat protein